jgi:lysophospholipase L1-like esterase
MADVKWVAFPDAGFEMNGLPWFSENSPELWRLPRRLERVVRPPVWELAMCPSGGRVRFSSDTTLLALRLEYADVGGMQNMCPIGQLGIAVYVDGRFWKPVWSREPGAAEHIAVEGLPREKRSYTLYLPLYHAVRVHAIGLDESAKVTPAQPFTVDGPVAFYGSSITQGGCASQAGLSYQAIIGRMLNLDFVNLGFSGEGRGEPEMAQAFAEIDASCFVLDFAQNCPTVEEMRERYMPFVRTVRGRHAATPLICITPIWQTMELYDADKREMLRAMRQVVREAVAAAHDAGDASVMLVEGTSLLSSADADGFVDGVHPNDIGFQRMAERLAPVMRTMLGLDKPFRERPESKRRRQEDGE